MKRAEKVALVSVAVIVVALVGVVAFTGVGSGEEYTAEYKRSEAEKEDVFREKVDKIFADMAEDLIKLTKETETADDPADEEQSIRELDDKLYAGLKSLDKLDVPGKYKAEMHGLNSKLLGAQIACGETIILYNENEDEKAYDSIQTIIDKFAEAQNAKNKMFGYK